MSRNLSNFRRCAVLTIFGIVGGVGGWRPASSAAPEAGKPTGEIPASAGLPPAPELGGLPEGRAGELIRYGQDLLANTSEWIGPKGKVKPYTQSRMACRNCHLEVGQRPFGNWWLDTQGLYPMYRAREGAVQTIAERVNACLQHPLLGTPLPEDSREMRAILLYFKWIARGRPSLQADPDTRLAKLPFLKRAADPMAGEALYKSRCAHCHGDQGQGKLRADEAAFIFPPLWGNESFMVGSSMSRISLLARFIKGNMPLGATAARPLLKDEEAWDLAAFVSSRPRPAWAGKLPFPTQNEKPFDYPIGPFGDPFPLTQHLLGPYGPIIDHWRTRSQTSVMDSMGI